MPKKSVKKTHEGVSIREDSTGLHVDVFCEYCLKPITVTSKHFGMDCEDHCAERAFKGTFEEELTNRLQKIFNI